MSDEMTFILHNPLTEEEWDMIADVDLDHTSEITFHTKHGKEVVFVKRKTGKWHVTDAYPHNVYCPECHKKFAQTHWAVWEDGSLPRNYCPNCGLKMEGSK